jgi:hypothetical protein
MKYSIVIVFLLTLTTFADDNPLQKRQQETKDMVWTERSILDQIYQEVYGFDGKIVVKKREEKTSALQKMDYPEIPENVLEIRKVIDLTNLVIEKYNTTLSGMPIIISLTEEWIPAEEKFKRKYDKYNDTSYDFVVKIAYKSREDQFPLIVFFDSFFFINYKVPESKTLLLPGLRILFDEEGKVKSVFCFYPPLNEDWVYFFRRTETGSQFLSFSLEDETEQSAPWILWDKEGKIVKQETRTLYLKDFDIPIDSEKIELRDSTPHEFWIPSESLKFSGR